MLLGQSLFMWNTHDARQPVAGTIAVGAAGGAMWAVIALAAVGLLRLTLKWSTHALKTVGVLFATLTIFAAPPLGLAVMKGPLHGRVMDYKTAALSTLVAACILILLGFFLCGVVVWTEGCIPLPEGSAISRWRARLVASAQQDD
ncbi:hypothetical protein HWV62_3504 [Athelia sp. TMB]|nr:hypothetical protein HWV62_3504 [Athelia sp. TMB]